MILLLCGLSGVGKTTLAKAIRLKLIESGRRVELIDGDEYRKKLFKDLSYTKEDRYENIRRLGYLANKFSSQGIVTIVSAINPYEKIRRELATKYNDVKIIHIDCPVNELVKRDTKGLYRKSLLPDGHPDKITNLTGVNDQFDIPVNPDLYINTQKKSKSACISEIFSYVVQNSKLLQFYYPPAMAEHYDQAVTLQKL